MPALTISADFNTVENGTMAERLSTKVGQLKSITFDLDSEEHDRLPCLTKFENDVAKDWARLGGNFGHLRGVQLCRFSTKKLIWVYFGFAVVTIMIVAYYSLKYAA